MATQSHHVISHYTTPSHENDLVPETEEDIEALWRAESAKLGKRLGKGRAYRLPVFVRGSLGDGGEIGDGEKSAESGSGQKEEQTISRWYAQLAANRPPPTCPRTSTNTPAVSTSSTRSSSLPLPPSARARPPPKAEDRRAQPDWFIHRALRSQAQAESSSQATGLPSSQPAGPSDPGRTAPNPEPTSAHSLARLLAQEPPPLPHEPRFVPPIWYALGPENKGYGLLRKGGWEEGTGLGVGVGGGVRSEPVTRAVTPRIKEEERLGEPEDEEEEKEEEASDGPEVIDLTQSRSPSPEETMFAGPPPSLPSSASAPHPTLPNPHGSTSLLTPLRPVLKADRLGLGLKPQHKKSSLSSKEIRAHIRAGMEAQKKKEAQRRGKGWRGFAREARREAEERRELMRELGS